MTHDKAAQFARSISSELGVQAFSIER